jgi:hypothetical protein
MARCAVLFFWSVRFAQEQGRGFKAKIPMACKTKDLRNPLFAVGTAFARSQSVIVGKSQKQKSGTALFGQWVVGCGRESSRIHQPRYSQCRLTRRSSGRANGVPPGPGRQYGVHFRRPGPGVTPSASPLAPTLGRRKPPLFRCQRPPYCQCSKHHSHCSPKLSFRFFRRPQRSRFLFLWQA